MIRLGTRGRRLDAPRAGAVTSFELFFDLVFVFTITQLTATIEHGHGLVGVGQAVLLLGLLWWMYGGYAWLTNSVPPVTPRRRLLLLLGMIGNFVCALAVPHAYTLDRWPFAIGYTIVVAVHAGMFVSEAARVTRGMVLQLLGWNMLGALCVIAGAWLGGPALVGAWLAALVVQVVLPRLMRFSPIDDPDRLAHAPEAAAEDELGVGGASFDLVPSHFVERHGLMLIIVLGESVLAIGVGVSSGSEHIGPTQVLFASIALALATALYWSYFGRGDDRAAEAVLERADPVRTQVIALGAYGYAFFVLIFGVVLSAAGLHHALGHPTDRLPFEYAAQLAGGVALFWVGLAGFRRSIGVPGAPTRIVVALVTLAAVPVGVWVSGLAELVGILAITVVALAMDANTSGRIVRASSEIG